MDSATEKFFSSISQLDLLSKFNQYRQDGDTKEMFKCIYNMEESHKNLCLDINNDCKNDLMSTKLREEGNALYKRNELREALEKYNKCILFAPHPNLSYEKIDTKKYSPLALGFGNRSALLFQIKEYDICLCDINRSLTLCNSKITQFKLKERKVKCLIAIKRYEEAQQLLKECNILLNILQLEEKVNESYKNTLSKLLQQCSQGINSGTHQNKKHKSTYEEIKGRFLTSVSNDDLIFGYTNPSPPSLDDEANPNIPAFSRALTLQHSPDQGRYVVATRDIKPGEIISVETAYTSCVDREESIELSVCTFCLANCAAPMPCSECTNVVFCNEECRSKGWDKFHQKECCVYSELRKVEIITSYRVIAGQSLDQLKDVVSQFENDEPKSPLEEIVNADQMFHSDAYRSIYLLEGNIKTVDTEKLIATTIKAFLMTQLLIKSKCFFAANTGDTNIPDEDDIIFIGSLLIHHMLRDKFNAYGIEEAIPIINGKMCSYASLSVGSGTYIAQSLYNHSCSPSAMIFYYGNVGVCRASRFIPSGSKVEVCYSDVYFNEPDRMIRRNILLDKYLFICNCDACVNDYKHSVSDVTKGGFNIFTVSRLRPNNRRISRNKNEKTTSLESELDALKEKNQQMTINWTNSPSCDVSNYLDLVLDSIEFFDRFVVIPDPMYIHLALVFREIFTTKSSCYFIK